MKKLIIFALTTLTFAALGSGCSKNPCELKTDDEKEALGEVANITAGAHSCYVQGASTAGGMLMSDLHCTIGNKDCAPMLEVIHGDGADVDSVAKGYRSWLETNKWSIDSDEASESKAQNGNTLKGVELKATNGDKQLWIRLFPFGDKLVQGRVFVLPKKA